MKAYIIAYTGGQFMIPEGTFPIFKSRSGAERALKKYFEKYPNNDNIKILVADNWHEEVKK